MTVLRIEPCIKCQPGTRVVIVDHVLAGLTGTVLSIDEYGQINLDIDDVDCSPVTVRQHHLELLDRLDDRRDDRRELLADEHRSGRTGS